MSTTFSLYLAPPKEPHPIVDFFATRLKWPSAWRWLTKQWSKELLEIKGYASLVSGMSREKINKECGSWEKSYKSLESYHSFLMKVIPQDGYQPQNYKDFLQIVELTKAEVANLITQMSIALRVKGKQAHAAERDGMLSQVDKGYLLELVER